MAGRDLAGVTHGDFQRDTNIAPLILQGSGHDRKLGAIRIGAQGQGKRLAIALQHAITPCFPAQFGQQRLGGLDILAIRRVKP